MLRSLYWTTFWTVFVASLLKLFTMDIISYQYGLVDTGIFGLKAWIGYGVFLLFFIPIWLLAKKMRNRKVRVKTVSIHQVKR
ncbi:hypothetical protein BAMA_12890 [Bacillus manliponensis]|uniref:Uncharacterized protein n=1 Tax=Bacillus manliponensis TaxID=574376 RepID=A0A073JT50_9BACI|nr:hypothetical protein [Bacillus manliponensis]KEK17455.1 hypothetical protein BAMA_12890 [Bacillus manliponensis]